MNFLSRLFKSDNIIVGGHWIGSYSYGDQYPEKVKRSIVEFSAKISENENGSFIGTINEIGEIDETSKIEGNVTRNNIRFIKTYEKSYSIDEDGLIKSGSHGPQHVLYEGKYDKSTQTFKGEWKIEVTYILEDGREIKRLSSGSWKLQRS